MVGPSHRRSDGNSFKASGPSFPFTSASSPGFEELVLAGAAVMDVPFSLVTVVDESTNRLREGEGIEGFCELAMLGRGPLVVRDARLDSRFAANPLVEANPGLRFYCGAPIVAAGRVVGTFCVADWVAHRPTDRQIEGIAALARQAGEAIRLREEVGAFRSARGRLASVLDALQVGVLILGREGQVIQANPAASAVLEGDLESLSLEVGNVGYQTLHYGGEPMSLSERPGIRALRGETVWDAETRLRWPDGHERRVRWNARPLYLDQDVVPYATVCTLIDVTLEAGYRNQFDELLLQTAQMNEILNVQHHQLVKANEQLACLATTDGLTGLRNHRAFQERLEQEILRVTDSGGPLSIALLDVDHFKAFNDEFGHQTGDAVLREVAQALESSVRPTDLAARYGGEEFVVVMPGTDAEAARLVCERLRRAIEGHKWSHRPVTASFGVASFGAEMDRQGLLEAADRALYESKREGRNRVTLAKK
jgi:diguanylate cyclase (GGDEF)-like protein